MSLNEHLHGNRILREGVFPPIDFCRQVDCDIINRLEHSVMYMNLYQCNEKVQNNYRKVIRDTRKQHCERCMATKFLRYSRHKD